MPKASMTNNHDMYNRAARRQSHLTAHNTLNSNMPLWVWRSYARLRKAILQQPAVKYNTKFLCIVLETTSQNSMSTLHQPCKACSRVGLMPGAPCIRLPLVSNSSFSPPISYPCSLALQWLIFSTSVHVFLVSNPLQALALCPPCTVTNTQSSFARTHGAHGIPRDLTHKI